MTSWWSAASKVLELEWLLFRRHGKLRAAWIGLLFVPALYVLIYLSAVWDPASHKGALAVGLVNADTGANYRGRDLNLGAEVLAAIERDGRYAYHRLADIAQARALVREGGLVFALVRVLGDLGRVLAILLLVVQVSSAGAVLPIELSDSVHQALNPYLQLTWEEPGRHPRRDPGATSAPGLRCPPFLPPGGVRFDMA